MASTIFRSVINIEDLEHFSAQLDTPPDSPKGRRSPFSFADAFSRLSDLFVTGVVVVPSPSPTHSPSSEFITPARRLCDFGPDDSMPLKELATQTHFLSEEDILEVHQMRFLSSSPLKTEAIATTRDGKHVILQQAIRSCVPSCIAMILMDMGKLPDYEAIKVASLATEADAIEWIQEAGLSPKITHLSNAEDAIAILSRCLKENGPGVLSIVHPTLGGHVVVLDAISEETNTAVIRDSFHGWKVSIKLNALKSYLLSTPYFIQALLPAAEVTEMKSP